MATVFWDSKGVLLSDFVHKGQRMTGDYYATLVHRSLDAIEAKRRGILRKGVLFRRDNAPPLPRCCGDACHPLLQLFCGRPSSVLARSRLIRLASLHPAEKEAFWR